MPESTHELVSLRPIVAADIPVWYSYLSDPVVYEHTSWNLQSADALAHYVWSSTVSEPSTLVRFAIAHRSTDQLAGTIGFHTVSHEKPQCRDRLRSCADTLGQGHRHPCLRSAHKLGTCKRWPHPRASHRAHFERTLRSCGPSPRHGTHQVARSASSRVQRPRDPRIASCRLRDLKRGYLRCTGHARSRGRRHRRPASTGRASGRDRMRRLRRSTARVADARPSSAWSSTTCAARGPRSRPLAPGAR